MVQPHIETLAVDKRGDVKPGYSLHHVLRSPLDATRPKMCANDECAPFIQALRTATIGWQWLALRE
jgi:hypothetical protein